MYLSGQKNLVLLVPNHQGGTLKLCYWIDTLESFVSKDFNNNTFRWIIVNIETFDNEIIVMAPKVYITCNVIHSKAIDVPKLKQQEP